jgi:hypothetical protein
MDTDELVAIIAISVVVAGAVCCSGIFCSMLCGKIHQQRNAPEEQITEGLV